MSFLRNVSQLPAMLVHHTGSMIRFTTAQLPNLPTQDTDCHLLLLDGTSVEGRFHLNPANPYIGGQSLVRWIKTWTQFNRPLAVTVEQVGRGNQLRLRTAGNRSPSIHEQAKVRRTTLRLARMETARRRREYSTWERDSALRKVALLAWRPKCQVRGCTSGEGLPDALLPTILEVHHLIFVSSKGSDSPLNVCLLCANHHALIHRSSASRIIMNDATNVQVAVDGITLQIDRDVSALWPLVDV